MIERILLLQSLENGGGPYLSVFLLFLCPCVLLLALVFVLIYYYKICILYIAERANQSEMALRNGVIISQRYSWRSDVVIDLGKKEHLLSLKRAISNHDIRCILPCMVR